jgi:hypothetical protein
MMKASLVLVSILFLVAAVVAQAPGSVQSALQQKVAEVRASMAANQAALKTYQWKESTDVRVKGDVKKEQLQLCRYGPDGKVQKTPTGPPPPQSKAPRGLKGKIVEQKVEEMKDYVTKMKSLIGKYVPPDKDRIHEIHQSGKASMTSPVGGVAVVVLNDYYQAGDKLTISFDTVARKIKGFAVDSYLDDPKNIVTLAAIFANLPDGTNYVQRTTLKSAAKEIEINIVNSNYQKISP